MNPESIVVSMTWEGASKKKDMTCGDGIVSAKATAGTFTVNWKSCPSTKAWEDTSYSQQSTIIIEYYRRAPVPHQGQDISP